MKITKHLAKVICLFAAMILALALWAGGSPPVSVSAAGAYDYQIVGYEVEMEVGSDRQISVREEIAVSFTGYSSHGIIRDLPLDAGVRYTDLQASCSSKDFSPYIKTDSLSYLSWYLRGSGGVSGQERIYTLTYTMQVPALSDRGYLPLDVIGYGWQTEIEDVTVKVTVPDGLREWKIYSGEYGTKTDSMTDGGVREGNTIIIHADELPRLFWDGYGNRIAAGITLDLQFEEGALSSSVDPMLLVSVLAGILLLAAAILVKIFVCKDPIMTATVNLEAPEQMDPLEMGLLIDNNAESEDLGALLFYFADKGYVFIDLSENEKDPLLVKTSKPLPEDEPMHRRIVYERLFRHGESVRVSSLRNSFYTTAQQAITLVKGRAGKLYSAKSKTCTVLFGVLAVLACGVLPLLCGMALVASSYYFWVLCVSSFVAFVLSAAGSNLGKQRKYKSGTKAQILFSLGGLLGGAIASAVVAFVPCAGFTSAASVIFTAAAALTGTVAGSFLTRTKEYTERLGQILGFKQFILYTERDKIEFMLKEDPELYYHILPYAQVLGVTDEWTEKFKGIRLDPPAYTNYRTGDFVFDCLMWNALFRSMSRGMSSAMVSRPSSTGGGGNFGGGGFGGGFGGGGFGGGGGRGC